MKLPRLSAAVLCLTLSAQAGFAADGGGSPDTVLFNGKVFTAVLSQDIFTVSSEQLPKTVSILTIVGGAIVYDAHRLPAH